MDPPHHRGGGAGGGGKGHLQNNLGPSGAGVGKKRKLGLVDIEAERTLYTSFVASANSLSQLYAQASVAQRRGAAAASKQTLEKILHWMMREHSNTESIPKASLLNFLQSEYEGLEGCENAPQSFPVQFPVHLQGAAAAAHTCDGRSPMRRGASTATANAMESEQLDVDGAHHPDHAAFPYNSYRR